MSENVVRTDVGVLQGNVDVDGTLTVAGNSTLGGITMTDEKNIVLNATTGSKIGTAATQKLGFFNATPIVQPSGAGQAALDTTTNSVGTAIANKQLVAVADTSTADRSAQIMNNLATISASVNEIRSVLVNLGLMKGSA